MNIYIIAGTIIVLAIAVSIINVRMEGGNKRDKLKYRYFRKRFFLTRVEHECYDALISAVGNQYYVFAQVHLSVILDHKVKGQDWRAALSHIDRKSVDYVLCDKAYISPKLVIELDDRSHVLPDRQERDREIERILSDAQVPLLRLENKSTSNVEELVRKVDYALKGFSEEISSY